MWESLWGGVKDFGGGLANLFTGSGAADVATSGAMNYGGSYIPDSLLGSTLVDEGAGTLASSMFQGVPNVAAPSLSGAYNGMATNGLAPAASNLTVPILGAATPQAVAPGMLDSVGGLASKGMGWLKDNKDALGAIGSLGKGYSDWRTSQIAQDRLDMQDNELNRVNTARANQQKQSDDIWKRAVQA